mmetsp:Transcript_34109/g.105412  ORF Transcript_34109/g.105412 Transcript_34109/m.105412 type:complete len:232 (-) Transcript_34109:813-1508(-)
MGCCGLLCVFSPLFVGYLFSFSAEVSFRISEILRGGRSTRRSRPHVVCRVEATSGIQVARVEDDANRGGAQKGVMVRVSIQQVLVLLFGFPSFARRLAPTDVVCPLVGITQMSSVASISFWYSASDASSIGTASDEPRCVLLRPSLHTTWSKHLAPKTSMHAPRPSSGIVIDVGPNGTRGREPRRAAAMSPSPRACMRRRNVGSAYTMRSTPLASVTRSVRNRSTSTSHGR